MLGLALHTASPELGLAVGDGTTEVRSQVWPLARELSSQLHSYLVEFLQPHSFQDVGFVAVARGPGGFTGTRIGVVTARTLAQQLDVPLYGVSTLAAVAWQIFNQMEMDAKPSPPDIAIQMPAQRGEWFTAIYRIQSGERTRVGDQSEELGGGAGEQGGQIVVAQSPDAVMKLTDWQQLLEQWPHPYYLHQIPAAAGLGDTVTGIFAIAQHQYRAGIRPHWSEVTPFYGQHPVQSPTSENA
ncbi:MAG: tRNA (adenosine(37)-N6)-threonylcarbamoyltransferase complex dimerization subunit type 1 TsaB [Thainema sp.]